MWELNGYVSVKGLQADSVSERIPERSVLGGSPIVPWVHVTLVLAIALCPALNEIQVSRNPFICNPISMPFFKPMLRFDLVVMCRKVTSNTRFITSFSAYVRPTNTKNPEKAK
jgi:hypothetical protein